MTVAMPVPKWMNGGVSYGSIPKYCRTPDRNRNRGENRDAQQNAQTGTICCEVARASDSENHNGDLRNRPLRRQVPPSQGELRMCGEDRRDDGEHRLHDCGKIVKYRSGVLRVTVAGLPFSARDEHQRRAGSGSPRS